MKQKFGFGIVSLLFMLIFMTVPASAKQFEEKGFYYEVKNKKAIITYIPDRSRQLVIPQTLGGFPVTKIGRRAAYYNTLEKVSFPSGLVEIGEAAFQDCKYLKEILFPANLKEIDESAFSGCTALTKVQFKNGPKQIGTKAFSNCISLKKVILSGNVNIIGDRCFEKCYKLSSVKLNKRLDIIGKRAFYKAYALKSITLPSGLDELEDGAFSNCDNLVRVKFANGKTKLGNGVFYKCESLKKAVLPKQIKNIPEDTFAGCRKIKAVTIPKKVSIIKKRAFYGCSALKSVKLNKRVYAIGDSAFADSDLQKLKLNSKMQFIGNSAFRATKLRSLKLPSKVTFIGNRVFGNCKKLKTIYIPSSVKGINPGAFHNCVSLRAIHVAGGNKDYASAAGVLYDKAKKKLIQYPLHKTSTSFRTPGSLQKIRKGAFAENPYLKHVTISAKNIGSRAFADMSSLTSVTIQSGTVSVDSSAFEGDESLAQVTLPDSVSQIGSDAFRGTAIRKIHIPSRLSYLGGGVFADCRGLNTFEGGRGSHYTVKDGVLYNGKMTSLIKYPMKKKGSIFVAPNTVKVVRSEAFERPWYLTKIEFGKGLRELNSHAIYGAKKLKSVVFQPKDLYYASSYAIYECDKLAVIVGPDTYTFRRMAKKANATLISL